MEKFGIGQALRRTEDRRLLTGTGRFVDDLRVENLAHGVVLRSPHAHARILGVDVAAARQFPGVLAVLTGADWQAEGLGGIPTRAPVTNSDGSPIAKPLRPGLALERVRFVGDPVAFVVAERLDDARSAAELIAVDYQPLPAVTDASAALAPGAPLVWDEVPGNLCVEFTAGDAAAVETAFAAAGHIVTLDIDNQRLTAVPIEPRAAIGCYDAASEGFTLIATTQNLHANRDLLAKEVFHVPPERLRQVAYDVGGGFGAKNAVYPEHALVLFAARRLGRPVKWTSERGEAFLTDTHGRDQQSRAELALSAEGDFMALRVTSVGNVGAYASSFGPFVPTAGSARTQGGPYRIPALWFRSRAAFTHSAPTDAYRGAGRPEASYLIERVIEVAAAEHGFDAIALRRRNLIRPGDLPYRSGTGATIDSGDFGTVLDRALAMADHAGFQARVAEAQRRGRLRGLGIGLYFECSGGQPREFAGLGFDAEGGVTLSVGSQSTGMGHETALPQIVAARLGLPFERITLRQGDTALTPIGGGHGGSRSLEMAGSASAAAADLVIEKARPLAGRLLEAAAGDLEFADGRFTIVGTERSIALDEVIRASFAGGQASELDSSVTFERDRVTYPNGCHVAEVEVDPDTGAVAVVGYSVVDDFGTIINPLLADGQVMGGTAQGIGQALMERIVYDRDSGQLLTGSLMDYALPRAGDLPAFRIAYYEDAPTSANPLGVKGAGEAGCVGAPPAVVNAVIAALAGYGVRHIDMPLTPERVWRAIRGGVRRG